SAEHALQRGVCSLDARRRRIVEMADSVGPSCHEFFLVAEPLREHVMARFLPRSVFARPQRPPRFVLVLNRLARAQPGERFLEFFPLLLLSEELLAFSQYVLVYVPAT